MGLLLMLMWMLLDDGPKYTVSPRFAPEPAVVAFLLLNIPDNARAACFVLDGPNYYESCREIDGRKSYRLEHKNVLAGTYQAVVVLDKLQLPFYEIIITDSGAPN